MMQRMGWREFVYLDIDGLLYFLNYLSFLSNMCILFLERSDLCLLNTTEFCSYSEHYLLHWTAQISFSLCAVCGHYYILFLFHITSSLFPQKVKYLYQCKMLNTLCLQIGLQHSIWNEAIAPLCGYYGNARILSRLLIGFRVCQSTSKKAVLYVFFIHTGMLLVHFFCF